MSSAECPDQQQQQQQQQQKQQQLLHLPVVDQQRRGSTESAYYSTCSDLPPDAFDNIDSRRGSWHAGDAHEGSLVTAGNGGTGGGVLRDRRPFQTMAHAEVVMVELAEVSGDSRQQGAADSWGSLGLLPDVNTVASPSTNANAAQSMTTTMTTSTTDIQLPTLMEEISEESVLPPAGLTGRLNTLASCDLMRPRGKHCGGTDRLQLPTPQNLTGRRFSLDARTFQLGGGGRGGAGVGAGGGGLFRLFHQESTCEQLKASLIARRRRIGNSRSTSDSETSSTVVAGVGDSSSSSVTADQNPSHLFRRFQSTDDDYFVALKVEESPVEVFSIAQDREQQLCVTADGQTVATEVSKPAPASTYARRASTADCRAHRDESEMEAALRLAKMSPFAYVPPRRLEPANFGPTSAPANHQSEERQRDLGWHRCVAEISVSSRSGATAAARVKQLAAKFNAGCK